MVGAVDGIRVMCLVQLHVHAAMGSLTVVLSVCVPGMGMMNIYSTLGDGVVIIGILRDDVFSDGLYGGGFGSGFSTLGDLFLSLRSVIFLESLVVSVGAVVWAFGAWRLIRVLAAVAS